MCSQLFPLPRVLCAPGFYSSPFLGLGLSLPWPLVLYSPGLSSSHPLLPLSRSARRCPTPIQFPKSFSFCFSYSLHRGSLEYLISTSTIQLFLQTNPLRPNLNSLLDFCPILSLKWVGLFCFCFHSKGWRWLMVEHLSSMYSGGFELQPGGKSLELQVSDKAGGK